MSSINSRSPRFFLQPLNPLVLSHLSSCFLLLFLSFTKVMNQFKKSQVQVLFVLVLLLAVTPMFPSFLRPTYLYFIFNLLIISLGAEAGLLSVFSRPLEDKKQSASVTHKPVMSPEIIPEKREASSTTAGSVVSEHDEKKLKVVEKSASEKIVCVAKMDKVKKCPSMPTVFFVGGGEADPDFVDEELEAEDETGGVNGQELCAKAEAFIGNFYKQLKLQREEQS